MREAFHSDLEAIQDDLVKMCTMVENAAREASTALLDGDLALAERVIAGDAHIDDIQTEIDTLAVDLLARQSPVATDLRLLVSAIRMSATIERAGDLAEHVALVVRRRHPEPVLPADDREDFLRLGQLVVESLRDAGVVVRERDLALAAQVQKRDQEIDALQERVYARIDDESRSLTHAQITDLTLLARFYERMGDHAVSVVRRIGFLVTGETVDPNPGSADVTVF